MPASSREEAEVLAPLFNQPLKKGDTWYVVSKQWWDKWLAYSRFIAEGHKEEDLPASSSERPGPIDSSELLAADHPEWSELKQNLTENKDFIFVHRDAYEQLKHWYGVKGPEFARPVITIGLKQMEMIDSYPLFLRLKFVDEAGEEDKKKGEEIVTVSRFSSLRDVIKVRTPEKSEGRAWMVRDPNASENQFVEESKNASPSSSSVSWDLLRDAELDGRLEDLEPTPTSGISFLIEFRAPDGRWPKSSSSQFKPVESLQVGDECDCCDRQGKWYESQIMELKEDKATGKKLFKIHFKGWATKYDEWVQVGDKDRLAPKNFHTKGAYIGKAAQEDDRYDHEQERAGNSKRGVVGLRNLGNTCFMNSALQCLSNTPGLTNYFINKQYLKEINRENPLGWGGAIAEQYGRLIQEMWSGKYGVVSPKGLKQALGEFQPRFSGYQQQDSAELLAFLLDGLHEDLNRVKKKPITQAIEDNGREDKIVADESWQRHLQRNQSVIVDLFQGQYKSTVTCPDCHKISITFDPFMYLTLPIPFDEKASRRGGWSGWNLFSRSQPQPDIEVTVGLALNPKTAQQWLNKNDGKIISFQPEDNAAASPLSPYQVHFYKVSLPYSSSVSDLKTKILSQAGSSLSSFFKTSQLLMIETGAGKLAQVYFDNYEVNKFRSSSSAASSSRLILHEVKEPDQERNRSSPDEELCIKIQCVHGVLSSSSSATAAPILLSDTHCFVVPLPKNKLDAFPVSEFQALIQKRLLPFVRLENYVASSSSSSDADSFPTCPLPSSVRIGVLSEDCSQLKQWLNLNDATIKLPSAGFSLCLGWENGAQAASFLQIELPLHPSSFPKKEKQPTAEEEEAAKNKEKDEKKEDAKKKKRIERTDGSVNLEECFDLYTKEETLTEDNAWYCNKCKKHQLAKKKVELWKLPDILVLHLKRFNFSKYSRDKIETLVHYPLENLDISEWCLNEEEKNSKQDGHAFYDCYAISHHFGGLGGGHYTAYAKNLIDGKWYNLDDSSATPIQEKKSLVTNSGYVLFYVRKNPKNPLVQQE